MHGKPQQQQPKRAGFNHENVRTCPGVSPAAFCTGLEASRHLFELKL